MHLVVGRVGRAHGIRGDVTLDVRTDDPDTRFVPGAVLTAVRVPGPERVGTLTVGAARWHGGRMLVSFAGVTDRSAAEGLQGVLLTVEVDENERPADPDEFYDHQLVGLRVVTEGGEDVGEVTEVLHLPGQDVLVVSRPGGGETLVPFVAKIVPHVDVDAHRLVIDPPPGLLDTSPGLPAERARRGARP